MEKKQNKKNKRNKTPLILALLLLLTLVVYTSHAFFSQTIDTDEKIMLTLGNLKIKAESSSWFGERGGEKTKEVGNVFLKVQPGDSFTNEITVENTGNLDSDLSISIDVEHKVDGIDENNILDLFEFSIKENLKGEDGEDTDIPHLSNYYQKNNISFSSGETRKLTLNIKVKDNADTNNPNFNKNKEGDQAIKLDLEKVGVKFSATQVDGIGRQTIEVAKLDSNNQK